VRVYVATRLHLAPDARVCAAALIAAGHVVTSTWHLHDRDAAYETALARDARRDIAARNVADVGRADALVLLAAPGMQGSLVEVGIAIGSGRPFVVVGRPEDVTLMVDVAPVAFVPSVDAAVAAIDAWESVRADAEGA